MEGGIRHVDRLHLWSGGAHLDRLRVGANTVKNDPESVAWRERMKGTALHYDPETETVAASPPTSPVHREEVPIDPTVAATLNAAKSLESI